MQVSIATLMTNKLYVPTGIECTGLPRAGARLQRFVKMKIYDPSSEHIFPFRRFFPFVLIVINNLPTYIQYNVEA